MKKWTPPGRSGAPVSSQETKPPLVARRNHRTRQAVAEKRTSSDANRQRRVSRKPPSDAEEDIQMGGTYPDDDDYDIYAERDEWIEFFQEQDALEEPELDHGVLAAHDEEPD